MNVCVQCTVNIHFQRRSSKRKCENLDELLMIKKQTNPALIKQYLNAPSLYKADYRIHLIKLQKANRCDILTSSRGRGKLI